MKKSARSDKADPPRVPMPVRSGMWTEVDDGLHHRGRYESYFNNASAKNDFMHTNMSMIATFRKTSGNHWKS